MIYIYIIILKNILIYLYVYRFLYSKIILYSDGKWNISMIIVFLNILDKIICWIHNIFVIEANVRIYSRIEMNFLT